MDSPDNRCSDFCGICHYGPIYEPGFSRQKRHVTRTSRLYAIATHLHPVLRVDTPCPGCVYPDRHAEVVADLAVFRLGCSSFFKCSSYLGLFAETYSTQHNSSLSFFGIILSLVGVDWHLTAGLAARKNDR